LNYIGEVGVIMINLSNEPQTVLPGEKIAQLVVMKIEKAILDPVLFLDETDRGDGGYGSTGRI
jgi:dUTP pyrophosphatase